MVLDDTSRVRASTRKMTIGPRPPAQRRRSRGRGAASSVVPGRAITTKFAASSTAGNSRHVAISANASLPRMKKICDGRHPSTRHGAKRIGRVRRSGSRQLHVRGRECVVALNGQRDEREPMEPGRHRIGRPMRRIERGDQQHPIELQRSACRVCRIEMSEMDRIERAAEDAEPARRDHASCRSRAGVSKSMPSSVGSGSGATAATRAATMPRQTVSRSSSSPSPLTAEIFTKGSRFFRT